MKIKKCLKELKSENVKDIFAALYGENDSVISQQQKRYENALRMFCGYFPVHEEVHIYSAPGRTEIGGNHTDHQRGMVLAGAVNLDAIAVAAFHNERIVRVKSEGYKMVEVYLDELMQNIQDEGTKALVKGIIAEYSKKGVVIGGFDMYVTSDVICGGGISSSAAFETLIATVINNAYNEDLSSPFEIARIGWFAENVFFGKKCGLLDQTVSSYGGLVSVDFKDEKHPVIEQIAFDFEKYGYTLCITDTKSSHENLTKDYVAINEEMRQIASCFHCQVLSQVDEEKFYSCLPYLRKNCSDRAVLRAMHFFDETKRAKDEAEALKNKDVDTFLKLVNESGRSSANLLQNLYSVNSPTDQAIPLAIALSRKILEGKGAVRVHGGGFAGTIQAFVPNEKVKAYKEQMEQVFGVGACYQIHIRPVGGIKII